MIDLPRKIFIDTSAWLVVVLNKEKYHDLVSNYYVSEIDKKSKIFTNDYVVDEAWTRLITNQSFKSAEILRKKVYEAEKTGHLSILTTDRQLFDRAWVSFKKFKEHKLSFTDCVIATMVKDLKIDVILTLDRGFGKIGLKTNPDID